MNKLVGSAGIVALLGWTVVAFYWSHQGTAGMASPTGPADTPSAASVLLQPSKHYPVSAAAVAVREGNLFVLVALSSLADSDPSVSKAISEQVVGTPLRDLFRLQDIVRNIVVTIDNLPRDAIAIRQLPLAPAEGMLMTTGTGTSLAICVLFAARYASFFCFVVGLFALV